MENALAFMKKDRAFSTFDKTLQLKQGEVKIVPFTIGYLQRPLNDLVKISFQVRILVFYYFGLCVCFTKVMW
jgi:hypothetical protein